MADAILFKLGTDNSGLNTGLAKAKGDVKSFGESVKSSLAGAISLTGIAAGIKSTISEFARVKDLADRFGTSAESIQRVSHAAEQSGASAEVLMKSLTKLTAQAGKGDEIFGKLGISATAFAAAAPDKQIEMLAKAFGDAEGDGVRTAEMFELLGTRAADLVPLLKGGREEFMRLMKDAPVASEAAVNALARADDEIVKINRSLKVGTATVLEFLVSKPAAFLGRLSAGDIGPAPNEAAEEQAKREAARKAEEAAGVRADNEKAQAEEERHQKKMAEIKKRAAESTEKLSTVTKALEYERAKSLEGLTQAQKNASAERIAELEAEQQELIDTVILEEDRADKEDAARRKKKQDARDRVVGDLADVNEMTPDERRKARREVRKRKRAERQAERELDGQPDVDDNGVRHPDIFERSDPRRKTALDRNDPDRAEAARKKIEAIKGKGKTLDDVHKVLDERLPKKAAN